MGSELTAWVIGSAIAVLALYVLVRASWSKRRSARRLAQADELGTRLMLEHGPVSAAQMQLVWHGIHQVIAVHGALDAEQLRYLITEARRRQN